MGRHRLYFWGYMAKLLGVEQKNGRHLDCLDSKRQNKENTGTCAYLRQESHFSHGKGFHGKAHKNLLNQGTGLVDPGATARCLRLPLPVAQDAGRRTPDAGSRTPDAGRRKPDAGRRKPDAGRRTVDSPTVSSRLYWPGSD